MTCSRFAGRTNRLNSSEPTTMPAGIAASSSPAVTAPPPNVAAYGTARPSGIT